MLQMPQVLTCLILSLSCKVVSSCNLKTKTFNITKGFEEVQVKSAINARLISLADQCDGPFQSSVVITACEETISTLLMDVDISSNRVPIGHGSAAVNRLTLETSGPYAEQSNATISVPCPIGGIAAGDSSHVIVDKLGGDFGNVRQTFIDLTARSTITFLNVTGDFQLARLHLSDKSAVYFECPVDIPTGAPRCTGGASVVVEGKPITEGGCVAPSTSDTTQPVPATIQV